MDFSNIKVPQGRPSDIDMWYLDRSGFLIIGELKDAKGTFTDAQRYVLKKVIDSHKGGGTILYIVHHKDVHQGDKIVDVSRCKVEEYYWHGKWVKPKTYPTVQDAFNALLGGVF